MQSLSSKKYTTLNTPTGPKDLTLDEYSRWLSLLEGVEFVSKRVEQLKTRNNISDIDWIKPLAFQKYIEERHESMKFDLQEIDKQDSINNTPAHYPCTTSPAPALV